MELKKGYKQTDIGVIPEDWEVRLLSEVVDFLDGQRRPIKSSERKSGEYPYYGASGIIDYVDNYIFDDDLILLGEDGENILSRNLPLAFKVSGKIWVNNHAHVLKPKENYDIRYLTDYLESLDYSLLNSGTAQPKLNKQACLNIKIACPLQGEQTAIATALSDADELIASLEKLIAKKRLIKQGAMQELLTGKRRLAGFEGEWEVRRLEKIAPLQRGFDLPNSKLQEGIYPVVYSNGILNYHIDFQVKGPGVVTGRSGTIGKVSFVDSNFWPHNTTLWVTNFFNGDPLFIFYMYVFIKLDRFGTGSGVPTLNRNDIHILSVKIPPSKSEQTAIAQILSDMDAEIEALEKKLAKYRLIKQGMMQNLLTGRIRLV